MKPELGPRLEPGPPALQLEVLSGTKLPSAVVLFISYHLGADRPFLCHHQRWGDGVPPSQTCFLGTALAWLLTEGVMEALGGSANPGEMSITSCGFHLGSCEHLGTNSISELDLCLCQFTRKVEQERDLLHQILEATIIKNPPWLSAATVPFLQSLLLLLELAFLCLVLSPILAAFTSLPSVSDPGLSSPGQVTGSTWDRIFQWPLRDLSVSQPLVTPAILLRYWIPEQYHVANSMQTDWVCNPVVPQFPHL